MGKCEPCGTAEAGQCEGHFGYIQLPVPVYHPSRSIELKDVLSLVCFKCTRLKNAKVKDKAGKPNVSTATCKFCRQLQENHTILASNINSHADNIFRSTYRVSHKMYRCSSQRCFTAAVTR